MRAQGPIKLVGAFLLVAGGSATALNGGAIMDGMARSQETVDAIRDRSPGPRTAAQMSKGKPRLAAGAPTRAARALPRVRDARGTGVAPTGGVLSSALAGPIAAPAFVAPVAPGGIAGGPGGAVFASSGGAPGGGGVFLPAVGGGFGPGGSGGGGGVIFLPPDDETNPPIDGTTPTTPPEDTAPEVPPIGSAPIPEPASWLMMILGFGTVGAAVRRRDQRVRRA